MRPFVYLFAFVVMTVFVNGSAFAQCETLPGLPGVSGVCTNAYTPNTPSTPADGPNSVGAPNVRKHDTDACDADFMNQIHARSFLEANRDVMISQLLVTKPDSVLEYSCFDQVVADTANIAPGLFSGSAAWVGSAGGMYGSVPNPTTDAITLNVFMGSGRLEIILDELVMRSLNQFVDGSFSHDFLGGTLDGMNNNMASSIDAVEATCTHMRDVWSLAKCENINAETFFMTFSEIVENDPRNTLPASLQCGERNPLVEDYITIANNDAGVHSFKDGQVTHIDFFNSAECKPPIPTGLTVTQEYFNVGANGLVTLDTSLSREFADHVCANPGCFYQYEGGGEGECVAAP